MNTVPTKTSIVHVAGLVCIPFVGCSTDLSLLAGGHVGGRSNMCHGMVLSYNFEIITES